MTDHPSRRGSPLGWVPVLGALAGAGCNDDPCAGQRGFEPPPEPAPGPAAPPEVLAGEWIGAGVLELQFSAELGSFGTLDPSRFALLSWSARAAEGYYDAGVCSLSTSYRALGMSYYGYAQSSIAEVWLAPEDPTLLRMRLTQPGAQCPNSSVAVAEGLLLTYTAAAGAGPELRDADGQLVPDLGPQWALDRLDGCFGSGYCLAFYSATGHLPALTSLAPIPCPT